MQSRLWTIIMFEMNKLWSQSKFVVTTLAILFAIVLITVFQCKNVENVPEVVITQDEYEKYTSTLVENAKQVSGIGLFAEHDRFAYRNARNMIEAYSDMESVIITEQCGTGYQLFAEQDFLDICLCIWIFLLFYWLVLEEKLYGQYVLNRTTVYGRGSLGRAKYCVALLMTMLMLLLSFCIRFLIVNHYYGIRYFSAAIQSVFPQSISHITLGQYLLFSLIGKMWSYGMFVSLCFALCVLFRKTAHSVWVVLGILCANLAGYYLVRDNSWLVLLKQLNLWHFLHGFDLFRTYTNVNLLGYPVLYEYVFGVCLLLLCLVCVPVCIWIYGITNGLTKHSARKNRFLWIPHTNGFIHEGYKLLTMGNWWLILVLALFVNISLMQQKEKPYITEEEYYLWQYCQVLQGEWGEEQRNYLEEEENRFEGLMDLLMAGGLEALAASRQLTVYNSYMKICDKGQYLEEVEGSWLMYEKGYEHLFIQTNQEEYVERGIVLLLLIICSMGTVWGMEFIYDQRRLIGVTKRGIPYVGRCKLLWSVIMIGVLTTMVLGPTYIRIIRAYGLYGWQAPAASLYMFAGLKSIVTIGHCVILQTIGIFLFFEAVGLGLMELFFLLFSDRGIMLAEQLKSIGRERMHR